MVLGLGNDLDLVEHDRVVETAQLRALAKERAGLRGVQGELILYTRQGEAGKIKVTDVEAVHHVRRGQNDSDVGVNGHHHDWRIRRIANGDGILFVVGESPAPLEGVDVDGDISLGHGQDFVFGDDGGHKESNHNQNRNHRVDDFKRHVILGLLRDGVTLAAIGHNGVQDQSEHEGTDDRRHDREALP